MDPSSSKEVKRSHDFMDDIIFLRINEGVTYNMSKDPNDFSDKIIKAMGNRAKNKEFEDCRVIVESTIFSVHSFVLLSCSEFFRCKYRTTTKETRDMTVRLRVISTSTFQRILDILCTGENLLTLENLREMWQAVHQLQIAVLIKLCEDFIVTQLSLDNLAIYAKHADYSHSKRVRIGILQLIMKNFSALRKAEVFLNLDMEDLKQVVESDDLVVESEDLVLQVIYGWVQSNENERKKYLADLLQCTRYCLASTSCITKLRQHPFSMSDSRVKEIFNRALAFKLDSCYMSGFWPTAAIYRDIVWDMNTSVSTVQRHLNSSIYHLRKTQ